MELIGENYNGIQVENAGEDTLWNHFFTYDVKEADFFLNRHYYWYSIGDDALMYRLDVGGREVVLPSTVYIMLADVYSKEVDWVRIDEIDGRDLTVPLYYHDLKPDQWSIEGVTVKEIYKPDGTVSLPSTKNLIPVKAGNRRMIFVSEKDAYVKTKKMNFAILY